MGTASSKVRAQETHPSFSVQEVHEPHWFKYVCLSVCVLRWEKGRVICVHIHIWLICVILCLISSLLLSNIFYRFIPFLPILVTDFCIAL